MFKVWSSPNGKLFMTLEAAQAYAARVHKRTGAIVAITVHNPRR